MARFEVGQTVYMGRGEKMRTLVVEKVIDNPNLPIYQYSFYEKEGFICGEHSLRDEIDGDDLTMQECFKKDSDKISDARLNTIANTIGKAFVSEEVDSFNVFFKPDLVFCKWLKEYANGRLIMDVGCGQGHLLRMLKMVGAKVMGIEPNFDYQTYLTKRIGREGWTFSINEILPLTVEQAKGIIKSMGENVLLVFARPCHDDFVEEGIDYLVDGAEALYITLPENLRLYNDLGKYEDMAVQMEHKGISEDNEIVLSIKK